jgi:hypothetical protein
MTVINCIAGAVYTRGFPIKEKVQLYGMAGLFLILLYNSPSGLVLYWTINNLFSLGKNILQKTKNPQKTAFDYLCAWTIVLIIYLLFFRYGSMKRNVFVAVLFSCIFFIPLFKRVVEKIRQKIKAVTVLQDTSLVKKRTFFVSVLILFLLVGLVIPSSIISSSVTEFSFIEGQNSPIPFIVNTLLQAAGFLFWIVGIYFLFAQNIRVVLTIIITVLCGIAAADTFLFVGNYGFLTTMLQISDAPSLLNRMILPNFSVLFGITGLLLVFLLIRKKVFIYALQSIMLLAFISIGGIYLIKIDREFTHLSKRATINNTQTVSFQTEYTFSKTGKNVLLIMLDRAISGYVPYIFEEKPQLFQDFSGFTYFPNCISFALHTLMGSPGIYGGYEYTPLEMQKKDTVPLVEKHNEALLMLHRIFNDKGYAVTAAIPPYSNYQWYPDVSIFNKYPGIRVNTILEDGKYLENWRIRYNYNPIPIKTLLNNNLIRFSLFKIVPPAFRSIIYDKGNYFVTNKFHREKEDFLPPETFKAYVALDILPEITAIDDSDKNTYTTIYNYLPHEPMFFQTPEYTPLAPVTDKGSGPFAEEDHYHVNMATFLLLAKWFKYLKKQGVYDNTRIIIVSDHGYNISSSFPNNITLPDGRCLEAYNALLLVKDFNSSDELKTNNSFMTNADVPLITTQGIIENPINPFTNRTLKSNKENGVTVTANWGWAISDHGRNKFNINKNEWLHVHDNIFDPANWEQVEVEP